MRLPKKINSEKKKEKLPVFPAQDSFGSDQKIVSGTNVHVMLNWVLHHYEIFSYVLGQLELQYSHILPFETFSPLDVVILSPLAYFLSFILLPPPFFCYEQKGISNVSTKGKRALNLGKEKKL